MVKNNLFSALFCGLISVCTFFGVNGEVVSHKRSRKTIKYASVQRVDSSARKLACEIPVPNFGKTEKLKSEPAKIESDIFTVPSEAYISLMASWTKDSVMPSLSQHTVLNYNHAKKNFVSPVNYWFGTVNPSPFTRLWAIKQAAALTDDETETKRLYSLYWKILNRDSL